MTRAKELVCLTTDPFIPGDEVTILAEALYFAEEDISKIYLDDPWWGVLDLTLETFVAATYAAYTAAAPPAWGQIMFNANRTAFKCGSAGWWGGKIMGHVTAAGSRVLIS